jgi:hypothetical protein
MQTIETRKYFQNNSAIIDIAWNSHGLIIFLQKQVEIFTSQNFFKNVKVGLLWKYYDAHTVKKQ